MAPGVPRRLPTVRRDPGRSTADLFTEISSCTDKSLDFREAHLRDERAAR